MFASAPDSDRMYTVTTAKAICTAPRTVGAIPPTANLFASSIVDEHTEYNRIASGTFSGL